MERKKNLVWLTALVAFAIFTIAALDTTYRKPAPVAVNPARAVVIGNPSAKIEIVVIEDFLCRNCCAFSREILPKIQSEYVAKGIARLTLVPVSFLSGSKIVANAAIEIYQSHPDQFFPFLQSVLERVQAGEIRVDDVLKAARAIESVDLQKLQICMEKSSHSVELEKNLEWARAFMGHQFRTPALYINGSPGSTFSFAAVKEQIQFVLRGKS